MLLPTCQDRYPLIAQVVGDSSRYALGMNAPVVMSAEIGRLIASCFALAAFAIAVLAGLLGGNDAAQILLRAVLATSICYVVGTIVGMICDGVIHRHVAAESEHASSAAVLETRSELGDASHRAAEGTPSSSPPPSTSIDRETVRARAAA